MHQKVTTISCSAPKLALLDRQGRRLGTASAAFYRYGGDIYLVTNWHVLTGLDAGTRKTIDARGATPAAIEIQFRMLPDGVIAVPRCAAMNVVSEDAEWLFAEHPSHGEAFDVAVLKVDPSIFAGVAFVNDDIIPVEPLYGPGDELFVLGYPAGLAGGVHYPIWKRGSIASEVSYDEDGAPRCLIDSATAAGMSGSPVIFRSNAFLVEAPHREDGQFEFSIGRTAQQFVGIYSGRMASLANQPLGAQLGIVWLKRGVEDVVRAASLLPPAPTTRAPVHPDKW